MKPLHTQLLPKKSTASASKISGSPPLISSWSRSSLMLRSEYLRWFLHEEWEIPNQNQLQTWVYSRKVIRWAVIIWATVPCQNRFSVSGRRIILNFAILLCKIIFHLPLCPQIVRWMQRPRSVLNQLLWANSLRKLGFKNDFQWQRARLIGISSELSAFFFIKIRQPWQ